MPLCKSTDLHFEYCVLVQSSQKTPTGGREAVKNGNKNEWFSYMKGCISNGRQWVEGQMCVRKRTITEICNVRSDIERKIENV